MTSSVNLMAVRERFGGRLRPPSRLDGRRVRRLSGVDEGDIDDPCCPPSAVDHQLDMANKLLIRTSLTTAPEIRHRLVPLDRKCD